MFKFMKKLFNHSKVNFLVGIIVGIIIMAGGVYAATLINSKDVFYDNASSTLSSTNVQGAIDELYAKSKNILPRYAFGTPTDSSPTDFKEVIASSGSNVFVRKIGSQLSVCLYYNNDLFCMKNGTANWETNKAMLNTATFPGATCGVSSSSADCNDGSFDCSASSGGDVYCDVDDTALYCFVLVDGTASCS